MAERATEHDNVWLSPLPSPERWAREGMKFVKVKTVDGHLTDISISMILVELKRRGLKLCAQ